MAYVKNIDRPVCRCGKTATRCLFNRFNAPLKNLCASCAPRALKAQKKLEEGE